MNCRGSAFFTSGIEAYRECIFAECVVLAPVALLGLLGNREVRGRLNSVHGFIWKHHANEPTCVNLALFEYINKMSAIMKLNIMETLGFE